MPGPIVHLIVEQRLKSTLEDVDGGREFADLLVEDPCDAFAGFGSIGPDFLFFSTREYPGPIQDLVNFVFGVYDALKPVIDFYDNTIGKLVDDVKQGLQQIDMQFFQGTISAVLTTWNNLKQTLLLAAADVATHQIDFFFPFKPHLQLGMAEKDWYWFDFLHYRRTGEFCSTMWQLAGNDAELQRYCIGYASHIGTDVVGHPFVNAVVGGPYRMHWHRHKLVENWIDAYARSFYADSQDAIQCLNADAESEGHVYVPGEIGGSNYYLLVLFPGDKLPAKLATLFADALKQVYGGLGQANIPPMLSGADVDSAYRLWLAWFERATTIASVQKPTPVPPPGASTTQLIQDYTSNFPPPPTTSPPSGGFSVTAIIEAILAFAAYVAEVASYTLDWIEKHGQDILNLPVQDILGTVLWLLYQAQKAIWEAYESIRFGLVLGAYLFPEAADLTKAPWGKALVNTAFAGIPAPGPAPAFATYPLREGPNALTGTINNHLRYPRTQPEAPYAEPMPRPFFGKNPEAFITQGYPFRAFMENLYDAQDPYGSTKDFTHFVDSRTWKTPQLGSALSFSARLIAKRMAMLPNFNLDGDRGYGWRTWRAQNPAQIMNPPLPVNYIDPP